MDRHPHFDLWLHNDNELEVVIGDSIKTRATIHEWPLSCVQRVQTKQGKRYIYKVQAPPTLEADFYTNASSPLLVSSQFLGTTETTTAMLMEEVDALTLNDISPDENEAVRMEGELLRQITEIVGELPVMFDISCEERWMTYIESALDDVRELVNEGGFRHVDMELVNKLTRWAEAPSILASFHMPAGYVHADLKAENVLVLPDGYRILDWQRPIRGPVAIDSATLFISLGIDPTPYVPVGIVQLYHFLHIAWYAGAARRWFPQGTPWYDEVILQISEELGRLQ